MLDIGWTELLLIAVVTIVVVGPKDLPKVLRTVGYWVRKARSLAGEFQGHIDDMIREAELEDVRKKALELRTGNLSQTVETSIDPDGRLRTAFDMAAPGKPEGAPHTEAVPPPVPGAEDASRTVTDPTPPAPLPPPDADDIQTVTEPVKAPDSGQRA